MTRPAVVFDFGAVLFRWQPVKFLQVLVPELAPDEAASRELAAALFQSFLPDGDWSQFDLGHVDEAALAERIARRTGQPAGRIRHVIDAIPDELAPLTDTVQLFDELAAAGYRMFYLSNMPAPYAALLTERNDFIGRFSDGVFSSHVGLMKPKPEIFALAEQRFGLDPAKTIFLDDNRANVVAARARGWQAVEFTDAAAAKIDLQGLGWLERTP